MYIYKYISYIHSYHDYKTKKRHTQQLYARFEVTQCLSLLLGDLCL